MNFVWYNVSYMQHFSTRGSLGPMIGYSEIYGLTLKFLYAIGIKSNDYE